jgi:hypothetical protein
VVEKKKIIPYPAESHSGVPGVSLAAQVDSVVELIKNLIFVH